MAGLLDFLGLSGSAGGSNATTDQPQQATGFGSGVFNNPMAMIGFGSGLLGGSWTDASKGMMLGMAADSRRRREDEERREKAQQKQLVEQAIAGNPNLTDAQKAAIRANPQIIANVTQAQMIDALPQRDDIRVKLERAGFKYGTPEYQSAYRQAIGVQSKAAPYRTEFRDGQVVVVDTRTGLPVPEMTRQMQGALGASGKAPAGYQWNPNKPGELQPIPGGPATKDQALPAELAGRVAITDQFLARAPEVIKAIEAGELTGAWDAGRAQMNAGRPGELRRWIEAGVDGLRRSLTGAGMPVAEANEYVRRYQPEYTDTAQTLASKVRDLTDVLQRYQSEARRGRQDGAAGGGRNGGSGDVRTRLERWQRDIGGFEPPAGGGGM